MNRVEELEPFVELLTRYQSRLYAFIYSLTADAEMAQDVFQETNIVLWRKSSEFDQDREFLPWAFAIARNQVRAARQKTSRDRLLFDEESVNRLADRASDQGRRLDERQVALASCLQKLPDPQRELVGLRYQHGHSLERIGELLSRSANAIAVSIHRARQALARCIEQQLARECNS